VCIWVHRRDVVAEGQCKNQVPYNEVLLPTVLLLLILLSSMILPLMGGLVIG
jgi:hypothetical protein